MVKPKLRPLNRFEIEKMHKGALIGENGKFAVNVVRSGNKILFFDAKGNQVKINPKALSRVPLNRQRAARRILALREELRKKSNPRIDAVPRIIDALKFFEKELEEIASAKNMTRVPEHTKEYTAQQMKMFDELKSVRAIHPGIKTATEFLSQYFVVPHNPRQAEMFRNGKVFGESIVHGIGYKKFIGVKDHVATYLMKDGSTTTVPLTNEAMLRVVNQRKRAIQTLIRIVNATLGSDSKTLALRKAEAREEIEVLRKNTKGRHLTPVQIAELYKYYKQKQS